MNPPELPTFHDVVAMLDATREEARAARLALADADESVTLAKEREQLASARVLVELGDEGTVAQRDAVAKLRTESHRFARLLAEQQYRAAKERVRDAKDELEAVRSLNSAVNAAFRTEPMGQPA